MRYITTKEVAVMLHKCEEQVRRYVREGRIRVYRPAGTKYMLFKAEDIEKFVEAGCIPSVADLVNERM